MQKIAPLLLLITVLGCRSEKENTTLIPPPQAESPTTVTITKPEPIKADPFSSTYRGNLPCSECQDSDVETILQLTNENRYFLTIRTTNDERHFSGQYRVSSDKRFIQLDDSADTLTFMLGSHYLEPRLPDGSMGQRQFPNKNYRLEREKPQPIILPDKEVAAVSVFNQ